MAEKMYNIDEELFLEVFRICMRFNNQYGILIRENKKYDRSFFNAVNVFVLLKVLNDENYPLTSVVELTSSLHDSINTVRTDEIDKAIKLSKYGIEEITEQKWKQVNGMLDYADKISLYDLGHGNLSSIRQYFVNDRFDATNFVDIYSIVIIVLFSTDLKWYMIDSLISLLSIENNRLKKKTIKALKTLNRFPRNRGYSDAIEKLGKFLRVSTIEQAAPIISCISKQSKGPIVEVVDRLLRLYYSK